ncbi:MAG TPA: DNA-directed RNA polymerase subunit alpha [Dehalococcoidia bacterium]|nr:DNA-directed RNA polymerase subunit alpha [Dehalococcoidia bacterium]
MAGLTLPKVECVESTETYGRFIAEPLERGFGVTLGNSLRRVLLSSLPGAAITWVKIEGIQHEFSTIPHVKEDTIDFLLNVKALRLHPLSQRSGKLSLEVEGEGEVCAADIKSSADFEIANPELHLATLDSPEAKLYVEFNVEFGKGYVPASSSDGLPIGVIPVDAIFTPVRKANYSVEPSRLGGESSQEKLLLEVWTDGTLSPTEAVSQSAAILMEQFSYFRELARTLAEEGEGLAWQRLIPPEQYNMPLDQLNLSTHTYNSLRRGSVTTLGQILEKGIEGLCSLAGFGAKSREEVETALKSLDLPFMPEVEEKKEKKKRQSKPSISSATEGNSNIEGEMMDETSDSRTEAE